MLQLQHVERLMRVAGVQPWFDASCEGEEAGRMAGADLVQLLVLAQPRTGELANRIAHEHAQRAVLLVRDDEPLVEQCDERRGHVDVRQRGHALCIAHGEPPAADGKTPEEDPLVAVEQGVAPLQRDAQLRVLRVRVSRLAGSGHRDAKLVADAHEAYRPDPRCRELDRQRQAGAVGADARHRFGFGRRQRVARAIAPDSIEQQRGRVVRRAPDINEALGGREA